jgi:hypothetical protein
LLKKCPWRPRSLSTPLDASDPPTFADDDPSSSSAKRPSMPPPVVIAVIGGPAAAALAAAILSQMRCAAPPRNGCSSCSAGGGGGHANRYNRRRMHECTNTRKPRTDYNAARRQPLSDADKAAATKRSTIRVCLAHFARLLYVSATSKNGDCDKPGRPGDRSMSSEELSSVVDATRSAFPKRTNNSTTNRRSAPLLTSSLSLKRPRDRENNVTDRNTHALSAD